MNSQRPHSKIVHAESDAWNNKNIIIASVVFGVASASFFFLHSNVWLLRGINLLVSATHLYFVYLSAVKTTGKNLSVSTLFFVLSIVLKFPVKF